MGAWLSCAKVGTSWVTQNGLEKCLVKHISVKAVSVPGGGERDLGKGIGWRREMIKVMYLVLFVSSSLHVYCLVYLIPSCTRGTRIKLFGLFCSFPWAVLTSSTPNPLIEIRLGISHISVSTLAHLVRALG